MAAHFSSSDARKSRICRSFCSNSLKQSRDHLKQLADEGYAFLKQHIHPEEARDESINILADGALPGMSGTYQTNLTEP